MVKAQANLCEVPLMVNICKDLRLQVIQSQLAFQNTVNVFFQ